MNRNRMPPVYPPNAMVAPDRATGTAPREPFARHMVARTADAEQARTVLSDVFLPVEIEPTSGSTLDVRFNAIKLGQVTAGYLRFGGRVEIRTAEAENYHVDIPLAGTAVVRSGRREPVYSTPEIAGLFMPGLPADLDWQADCAQLCLMLPRAGLQAELQSLLGRTVDRPLDLGTALDLRAAAGRTLLRTLLLIERESRREGGLLDHRLAAQNLERVLLDTLLLAVPHNYSEVLSRGHRVPGPRAVRSAIELLRVSPERNWTVSALASEVSLSVRSLQSGFRGVVATTPTAYLRELRLERVHSQLAAAEPGSVTVTAVAARWGFTHLGRFAAAYRSRYDERPSETLSGRLR